MSRETVEDVVGILVVSHLMAGPLGLLVAPLLYWELREL